MKSYMFKCFVFISCLFYPLWGVSQILQSRETSPVIQNIDTIVAHSNDCRVMHYHERSHDRDIQMLGMRDNDIFNDSINDFSKLIITQNSYNSIMVSTIPMDNIIVLENKKLIIGLTKISSAPYKVVIYDYNAKLVYKGALGVNMIKVNRKKLKSITREFPELISIFKRDCNVIKKDSLYYIELTNDIKHVLGSGYRSKYFLGESLFYGTYLPFYMATSWGNPYDYHRLPGGYLSESPYSDLIVINDVPFVLVLNNTQGGKSYIPLVSNCDIETELSQKRSR